MGRKRIAPPSTCTYSEASWAVLAKKWFPIARCIDIGEKPLATALLDVKLVVYRTEDGILIKRDLCPHRGVPLSMGWVEGNEIVCPYHGLRFAPDGRCTLIPAQPDALPGERFRATTLPVEERYGLVWTSLDPVVESDDIPPFPQWDDASFQPIVCPPVSMNASPGRQMEGFIDVAHFAWVHHEAFADRANSIVPSYTTKKTQYGLQSEYISSVSNFPKALRHLEPEGFQWRRVFDVYPPFVAFLTIDFPDGGLLKIMNIASPVSARKTTLYVPIVRNFDKTGPIEDVYTFNAQVFSEDQAIIEAQTPEDLPLGTGDEAHFAADRSSVAYRRILRDMGLD